MNNQELLEVVGEWLDFRVVAGRYGNAGFTRGGYLVGDPAYLLGNPGQSGLADDYLTAVHAAFPRVGYDYLAHRSGWHALTWRGKTCYELDTGGDGESCFGLVVDSGCLAAIPVELALPQVQSVFRDCLDRDDRTTRLIAAAAEAVERIPADELES